MDKATWERRLVSVVKVVFTAIVVTLIGIGIKVLVDPGTTKRIQDGLENGLQIIRPLQLSELYIQELKEIWSGIPSEQKIEQSDSFQQQNKVRSVRTLIGSYYVRSVRTVIGS